MKASTFFDYCQLALAQNRDYNQTLNKGTVLPADDLTNLHTFYGQPFRQEMLLTLFSGWQRQKNSQGENIDWYYSGSLVEKMDDIDFIAPYGKKGYYINEIIFPLPATLDIFISDCSRAGVELTWQQEVINNYFAQLATINP